MYIQPYNLYDDCLCNGAPSIYTNTLYTLTSLYCSCRIGSFDVDELRIWKSNYTGQNLREAVEIYMVCDA